MIAGPLLGALLHLQLLRQIRDLQGRRSRPAVKQVDPVDVLHSAALDVGVTVAHGAIVRVDPLLAPPRGVAADDTFARVFPLAVALILSDGFCPVFPAGVAADETFGRVLPVEAGPMRRISRG